MNRWTGRCGYLFCLSPSLLIGLICYGLYSSENKAHNRMLIHYNASVEDWQNCTQPLFFSSANWAIAGDTQLPLIVSGQFQNDPPLPTSMYNSPRQVRLQLADANEILYAPFHWPSSANKVVRTLTLLYDGQPIYSQQLQIAYTINAQTGQECSASTTACTDASAEDIAYLVARDICFIVEDTAEKNSQPYVHSSVGCGVDGDGQSQGNIVGYQQYSAKPSECFQGPSSVTLAVRSELDPWVIAGRLTEGTYFFGPTLTQQHYLLFAIFSFMITLLQGLVVTWFCRGGEGVKISVSMNETPLLQRRTQGPMYHPMMLGSGSIPGSTDNSEILSPSSHSSSDSNDKQAYYRARLTNFYKLYNPKMLGSIEFLLEQYRGREVTLLRNLETKSYQELPEITEDRETSFEAPSGTLHSFEADAEETLDELRKSFNERQDRRLQKKRDAFLNDAAPLLKSKRESGHRDSFAYLRLKSLFERFNPDGLGSIDYLLTQYKGREMSLIERYERKFVRTPLSPEKSHIQSRGRLASAPEIHESKENLHSLASSLLKRSQSTFRSSQQFGDSQQSLLASNQANSSGEEDEFDCLLKRNNGRPITIYGIVEGDDDSVSVESALNSENLERLNAELQDIEEGLTCAIHGNPFRSDIRIASNPSASSQSPLPVDSNSLSVSPHPHPPTFPKEAAQSSPFGGTDIRIASKATSQENKSRGGGSSYGSFSRSKSSIGSSHGNPFQTSELQATETVQSRSFDMPSK
mmetsp:Transcript_3388/g.4771  ORF Transcript_3388/g.4771 Transcript_3388/m.4771 type:complete len:750 (+) Transcript_3388:130-2379(+)